MKKNTVMSSKDCEELQLFAETAAQNYADIKKLCESQVNRWEWTKRPRYRGHALYFKRFQFSRGRILKEEPTDKNGCCQYGFNRDGLLMIERNYVQFEGQCYEQFYSYNNHQYIDAVRYSYSLDKPIINVERQRIEDGRIVSFSSSARGNCSTETYEYDGKNLVAIISDNRASQEVIYNDTGQLIAIKEGSRFIYQKPDKQQTMKALTNEVELRLIKLIPQVISRISLQEPICCVALIYDWESDYLPPMLSVALESERQAWIAHPNKNSRDFLKSPWEWTHFIDHLTDRDDNQFQELCRVFNQQYDLKGLSEAPLKKLLNTVAFELMKFPWASSMNVTSDFIVYAVDTELCDFRRNIKLSVPPPLLAILKHKRLL